MRRVGIVRILEHPTHRDRGRLRVDLVVQEIDDASVGVVAFPVIHQPDVDDKLPPVHHRGLRLPAHGSDDANERRLIDIEVDVDRIDRHNRRQRGRVLIDEVADLELRAADLAGDRGGDRAELDVEPGELHLGAGRRHGTGVFLELRLPGIEFLHARGPLGGEFLIPCHLHLGETTLPEQFFERALRFLELGHIRAGVDFVERVASLHELPVAKEDLGEVPRDPTADIHLAHGLDAASDLQILREEPRLERGDGHLGRRSLRGGLG